MQGYMEHKLTGLHETTSFTSIKEHIFIFTAGLAFMVLLPYLHIGVFYQLWDPNKPPVNKWNCTCGCFDTVFRGAYEWPPAGYKHVYFNATKNTLKIWILVVMCILATYETLRYLIPLLRKKQVRTSMFLLLLSSIYPHYYGCWGFFNYLNETFYYQWYHQLFFTITEVISTCMVLHLCNSKNRVMPWKLLVIIDINVMHIIVGGLDLFLAQIFYRQGTRFENVRNFGLLVPDLFHVLLPFFEVQVMSERKGLPMASLFYKEEIMMSVLLVTLFSILGRNL